MGAKLHLLLYLPKCFVRACMYAYKNLYLSLTCFFLCVFLVCVIAPLVLLLQVYVGAFVVCGCLCICVFVLFFHCRVLLLQCYTAKPYLSTNIYSAAAVIHYAHVASTVSNNSSSSSRNVSSSKKTKLCICLKALVSISFSSPKS